MANKLQVYKIEDSQTGQIYEIEGPEGASDDELYSYLESTFNEPQPKVPVSPTNQNIGAVASPEPAAPSGVQPPGLQRQKIVSEVVSGQGNNADPRFLSGEEESQLSAAWGDPNVTDEQYHEMARTFSERHGRLYAGQGSFGNQRTEYQQYIAQGGAPMGPEYSSFTDTLPDAGPTVKSDNVIVRAYQDAIQYGTPGWLARTYHDWVGTGMDQLRQRFPDASEDELEQMQESIINHVQGRVREANAEVTEDDPLIPWLAGQVIGSAGIEDFIPGGAAGGGLRGVARRTAGMAGINTAADVGYQAADIAGGVQDEYNIEQTLLAPVVGGAFHLGIEGAGALARSVRRSDHGSAAVFEEAPSTIAFPEGKKNSRGYRQAIGQTADQIAGHISRTAEGWTNSPEFVVHQNFKKIDGLDDDAIGATMPDGRVFINTEALLAQAKAQKSTPETVATAVTFHEALGHYGLSQRFGDELEGMLGSFYDNSVTSFKDKVDKWLTAHPDAYKNVPNRELRAAEEILAEMSERGQLPVTFVNRITNMLKGLARDMGLNLKFSEREIRTILGMAHSAVVNGKGRDVRGNGFRYMNVGKKANLPINRQSARVRAEAGEARGANPDETYRQTGWWKDQDEGWRTRISDFDSGLIVEPITGRTILEDVSRSVRGRSKLGRVIDHPELFQAYPWLKDMPVNAVSDGSLASYISSSRAITFDYDAIRKAGEDPHTVLLHEIQHAIQHHEGWASGGNTQTALEKTLKDSEVREAAEKLFEKRQNAVKVKEQELEDLRSIWANPEIKEWRRLFDAMFDAETDYGINSKEYLASSKAYDDFVQNLKRTMFKDAPKSDFEFAQEAILFGKHPQEQINELRTELEYDWGAEDDFRADLESGDLDELRTWVKGDYEIRREAYDWLMGEIEARETEKLQIKTQEELDQLPPGVGRLERRDPNFVRITKDRSDKSASMPGEYVPRRTPDSRARREDQLARRRQRTANAQEEYRNLLKQGIDPTTLGLPEPTNYRYMKKRSQPEPSDEDRITGAREIRSNALDGYEPTHRSWAEAKRAARDRGLTAKQIRKANGVGDLDKRLFQYDRVADATDAQLATLHEKINSGDFNMKDKAKYLETVFSYNELLARIFDDQAEIGRALNAMKAIQFTKRKLSDFNNLLAEYEGNSLSAFADDKVFNDFVDQVRYLMQNNRQQAAHNLLKQVLKPYWWQYILSARHAAMLSGIGTHAKNALDNTMIIARELEEQIMALPAGVFRKGLRAAGANVKEGVSPQEVAGRMYGLLRAAFDGATYMNTFKAFKEGHANTQYSSKIEMQDAHIPGLSKVQDALHASDTFFRAFHTNANLYTLGVRQAREQGFRGISAFEEGSNIAANPTKEMIEEARKYTDLSLLVDTPSTPASKLESAKAIRPGMKAGQQATAFLANMLFPFFRVTDRLLFQKLRRTPLAFLDRVTREDLAAGGARMDIALARITYGSALIYYYWNAAGEGEVTGEGPADPAKRTALEAGGYLPNSVPQDGKMVDASALNLSFMPWDLQNSMATNIATIRQAYESGKADGDDTAKALGFASMALLDVLASNSFAENLLPYTELLGDEEEGRKELRYANATAGLASQFVPAAVRQYNQQYYDTTKRDTTGDGSFSDRVYGRVASSIPGLSDDLPAKYDVYGDLMQHGRSLSGVGNYQNIKDDEVSVELQRLEQSVPEAVVRGAPSSFQHEGEDIKLSGEGKQEWNRVQGFYLRLGMSSVIRTDEWKNASEEDRIAIVKEVRKEAYDLTKQYMLPLLGVTPSEE